MPDRADKLSPLSIGLHWSIAVAILIALPIGLYMEDLPKGPERNELIALHSTIGLVVLLLAVARIAWRTNQGLPAPLGAPPPWQHRLAVVVHWGLLVATIAMPLSGIAQRLGHGSAVDVFGLFTLGPMAKNEILAQAGGAVHGIGANVLMVLLLLHVAGALKHQFVDRDGTFARMLGRRVNSGDT